MACVALLSLMRTLELEFLQPLPRPILQEMELISCNKEFIQSLHEKLGVLIQLLDEKRKDGVEAIKELETKLRDVAFRVEDEIEFQIARLHETEEEEFGIGTPQGGDTDAQKSSSPSFKLGLILQQGMEDIDAVKEELVKIKNEYMLQGTLDVLPISVADSSQPAASEIMVGRDNEFKIIKEMLIYPSLMHFKIVLINGMRGIGKTMLARKIYEDQSIASYFHMQAWVVASQHYNKRQMLLGLLNSLGYTNNSSSDEDLSAQLRKALLGRRYLLVIDDVWSVEELDAILGCILDDKNDTRVLFTTRLTKNMIYNSRYIKYFFRPMQMHLLDQSESWNLFCIKAHNTEFETIGKPIVEKCNGVPLAIVMVASLFSKLNTLSELELENIAETINLSAMTTIIEACSRIFSLDYNDLSYKVKACFLYLGVFPEGKVIYVKDVARLWASEGLIKEFEDWSLDEVAERCVQELLDKSLIFESKRSYCGRKIKAFEMHGLQHAFCVRQAQKENLLHVVDGNGFNFCVKGFRWLSIQSTDFDSASSSITCRSIFCFLEVKSLHLKSFSLLRVFYFTDASMCKKIVDLVHLRYLPHVVRDFRIIKLLKAWNLQTLSIYADDERYLMFRQQQDSQTPSKLLLKPCDCTIDFFLKNKYLKEVIITGERKNCNDCIDTLVFALELRGLYINGNVWDYRTPQMISINNQIARLKGITELSFKSMNFEWKGINVLCQLPRLEVLRLLFSGIGKEWQVSEEDTFQRLLYFEIFSTDLKHWRASSYNFPRLERLLLRDCFKLRKIPIDFAESITLNLIELRSCLLSAVVSAKQIQEEQHEYGNDDMVVIEKETIIQVSLRTKKKKYSSDEDEAEES